MSRLSERRMPCSRSVLAIVLAVSALSLAAEPTAGKKPEADETAQRDERFRKLVANVRLSGHFTIDGAANDRLQREEYAITSASRLGTGDVWLLTSRIRYGKNDLTVPVPVRVKWAGDTPVISLDKVAIPGLGTFSARVVLDEGRYAGTWSHDSVGGHMFGTITPMPEAAAGKSAAPRGAAPDAPADVESQSPSQP